MNNPTQNLPGWGEMPKRPGLYLSLTHGRDFPQQFVKTRGFAGPKIGPLLYVQTLYAQQVTLRFANARELLAAVRPQEPLDPKSSFPEPAPLQLSPGALDSLPEADNRECKGSPSQSSRH
jgi:hypothetical protein